MPRSACLTTFMRTLKMPGGFVPAFVEQGHDNAGRGKVGGTRLLGETEAGRNSPATKGADMVPRGRAANFVRVGAALAALSFVLREAPSQTRVRNMPPAVSPGPLNPFAAINTQVSSNGGIAWPGPTPPGYYLGFNSAAVQFPSISTSNFSGSGSGGSGGT